MHQKIELTSKRNKVYRIKEGDKSHILKIFTKTESLDKEVQVLRLLNDKGLPVAKILETNESSIILEDLGESTLLSIYEELEKNNDKAYGYLIKEILSWLEGFYKVTQAYYGKECILLDMNFRNFILKEGRIYRIDFEEVTFGKKESDIGKLLAFGLTYNPKETEWKKDFEKDFIKQMENSGLYDVERVIAERDLELEKIKKRRKKS